MEKDLPTEIHDQILAHLDTQTILEYQRVCRQWYKPANCILYTNLFLSSHLQVYKLIDTLEGSPHLRELVKDVEVDIEQDPKPDPSETTTRILKYSQLIQYTPNLDSFHYRSIPAYLYTLILQQVQQGQWKRLRVLRETGFHHNLPLGYYAVISAIQDRLEDIELDLTTLLDRNDGSQRYVFSSCINNETRFRKVKTLFCRWTGLNRTECLDDILSMCPVVTELTLDIWYLKHFGSLPISPNTTVEDLCVYMYDLTYSNLDYIRHKFSNLKQLSLYVFSRPADSEIEEFPEFTLSLDVIELLLDFTSKIKDVVISMRCLANTMDLFDAFSRLPSGGEMHIDLMVKTTYPRALNCNGLAIYINPSRPKKSMLEICPQQHGIELNKHTIAYLNQLDDLVLHSKTAITLNNVTRTRDHRQLLLHCHQLKSLCMYGFKLDSMDTKWISLQKLVLQDCNFSQELLTHISYGSPALKTIHLINCSTLSNPKKRYPPKPFIIDMPNTSIKYLLIKCNTERKATSLALQIVRLNKSVCFEGRGGLLTSISTEQYDRIQPTDRLAKIEIVCQDIEGMSLSFYNRLSGHERFYELNAAQWALLSS
ncbi:hypothetical protein BD560DRAFT_451089 [Blakeslea trispora]|nr:hypothetical protein BD560DRAFT_451089 [Blakeslea trispora]